MQLPEAFPAVPNNNNYYYLVLFVRVIVFWSFVPPLPPRNIANSSLLDVILGDHVI